MHPDKSDSAIVSQDSASLLGEISSLASFLKTTICNLGQSLVPERTPVRTLFKDIRFFFKLDEVGLEIVHIALPAALALTADPIASLIDTAFIGQIGSVELAAVGVSIALFNQVSRIAIFPLVSVTTSFVAEEDASQTLEADNCNAHEIGTFVGESSELLPCKDAELDGSLERRQLSGSYLAEIQSPRRHIQSASSALLIGSILGVAQAVLLVAGAKPLLNLMGVKSDSPMVGPARKYLTLRSLGSPAILLSLAMQGVFRGFKDTKTPLYATVAGDLMNIILDPLLIFTFHMGVSGAAVAHVISQYFISIILLWRLLRQVDLIPPSMKALQLGKFLKNGFLLLIRVIAVTFCVTFAASLAARHGPETMAAFQVGLQVWLATSLLADGLAVASQAMLASAFVRKDYNKAIATTARVLQLGLVLGLVLSAALAVGLRCGAWLFTKDAEVLKLVVLCIPFVAGTQPINVLAFVFDGINFGASDFAYSAYSMVFVALVSIVALVLLSMAYKLVGIWIALTIYMSFRALAGFWRIGTGTGPWEFLRR